MPGIAGFVTRNTDRRSAQRQLSKMLRYMRHDPSYVQGQLAVPEWGLYLGWSNLPDSNGNVNPVHSRLGDVTLVFCGEHFCQGDLPDQSSSRRRFMKALEEYRENPECLVRGFNGWFAGVLIDYRRHTILLFNDRYAMSRVYVRETPDAIVFASEAKAVLSVDPTHRSLDAEAVGQHLAFATTFGDRTLFRDLQLLPGASCWDIARPGAVTRMQYFEPTEWSDQPPLDEKAFATAMQDTLRRILPMYFSAGTPVGLSLTGGLDTRMVLAGMPQDGAPRPCYTYAGIYRECFDIQVARQVAHACGLRHAVLPLDRAFFDRFREYAERTIWLTDGSLDLTGAHELYFSELARLHSPVRLTGNYGSEILRSVCTFKYDPVPAELVSPDATPYVHTAKIHFDELRRRHPLTFAAFCQLPWQLAGRRLAAEAVLVLRSPFTDNELVALAYRAPAGVRESTEASVAAIRALNPALARIPTDMGRGGSRPWLTASLSQLYRYVLFKGEWYYNLGMPDFAVRWERVIPIHLLEPAFLGKHKIEHYRLWFRGPLRRAVLDLLSDAKAQSRPYLNRKGVERLLDDFASNRRNRAEAVSRILTLELAQRLLIERAYD